MWAKNERGAASMEYVAMLLVAALFAGAVAVSIKPEWVRYKVCQALVAISGEGSCSAPAKPPAQTPPKVCTINSSTDSATIHGGGKAVWLKGDLEAGYGYRYIERSDGSVDVELFYDGKVEAGGSWGVGGNGKVGGEVSATVSGKLMKGESFHYDSLSAAKADQGKLKQYAEDKALSAVHVKSTPKLDSAKHTGTSDVYEFGVTGKGTAAYNGNGNAYKSTVAGGGVSLSGKVLYTTKRDDQTGSVTTKIETTGSGKISGNINGPSNASGTHVSLNGQLQGDRKASVAVTKDKSGKITELVITQSEAGGADGSADLSSSGTGKGKYKPRHAADKSVEGSSETNYQPRHAAKDKGSDINRSRKGGVGGMGRKTTTYRLAVNDSNRAKVIDWLGSDSIEVANAPRLLLQSAIIDPLNADPSDDFEQFLRASEDVQIDAQTSLETSSSEDHAVDLGLFSGGKRDDTGSTSSTGQIYWALENGHRVPHPVVGCR